VTEEQLNMLSHSQNTPRPKFLSGGEHFSRDIALRLTALRESFEEVGILICTSQTEFKEWDTKSCHPRTLLLQPGERSEWQHRVHNDASQFLELCRHLNVIPNLWALQEWSIWRTAATANRKYDTVYYITALDEQAKNISLLLEPHEVASAHWMSPAEAWTSSQTGVIWLPFMLLYDIARLMNLHSWQELLNFARHRSSRGGTMVQPVYYRCDDCMFGVLPGDDLYPMEPGACTQTIIYPNPIPSNPKIHNLTTDNLNHPTSRNLTKSKLESPNRTSINLTSQNSSILESLSGFGTEIVLCPKDIEDIINWHIKRFPRPIKRLETIYKVFT